MPGVLDYLTPHSSQSSSGKPWGALSREQSVAVIVSHSALDNPGRTGLTPLLLCWPQGTKCLPTSHQPVWLLWPFEASTELSAYQSGHAILWATFSPSSLGLFPWQRFFFPYLSAQPAVGPQRQALQDSLISSRVSALHLLFLVLFFQWSWGTPVKGSFDLQQGCDPPVEGH